MNRQQVILVYARCANLSIKNKSNPNIFYLDKVEMSYRSNTFIHCLLDVEPLHIEKARHCAKQTVIVTVSL